MSARVSIERLRISLHGVSAETAEAAVRDLAGELRRRWGGRALEELPRVDLGVIAIGPFTTDATLDAAALRAVIAERLSAALFERPTSRQADSGGID